MDLNATMDQIELGFISEALKRSDFSKTKAAKLLGINRTTLIQKLKKHGIPLNAPVQKGRANIRVTPVLPPWRST
jgi:DNA-binding NtrC family response regulator